MEANGSSGTQAKHQRYWCFLVRCWLEEDLGPGGEPNWRFTIQQADPGAARRSFTCFRDVEMYLEAELAACGASVQDEPKNVLPLQFQDISEVRTGGIDEHH